MNVAFLEVKNLIYNLGKRPLLYTWTVSCTFEFVLIPGPHPKKNPAAHERPHPAIYPKKHSFFSSKHTLHVVRIKPHSHG